MAYSYDDFVRAAQQAGVYGEFSAYDLQLAQSNPDIGMGLLSAKQQWHSATDDAGRSAANSLAESYRSNASQTAGLTSYTGGSWGNQYNPIQTTPQAVTTPQTQTSFSANTLPPSPTVTPVSVPAFDASALGTAPQYNSQYTEQINGAINDLGNYPQFEFNEQKPEWNSRYDAEIQGALKNVTGYGDFSYNYETDPLYSAYAKQYRREGDRAMQGVLAQKAAQTGGNASTAAIAAAQQANNDYNAQLADKIPALYAQAYDQYANKFQMNQSKLGALQNAENSDYEKYTTKLGQYNTDRSFQFGVYQDAYNQLYNKFNALLSQDQNAFSQSEATRDQFNTEFDRAYQQYRDQVGDSQYDQQMAYNAARDAYDDAYNKLVLGQEQENTAYDRRIAEEQAAYDRQYDLAKLGASYGDYSGLAGLGITPAPETSGGGGGSSGGAAIDNTVIDGTGGGIFEANTNDGGYGTTQYVEVEGYGKVSVEELARLIDAGVITEQRQPDGTYKYVKTGKAASKPVSLLK